MIVVSIEIGFFIVIAFFVMYIFSLSVLALFAFKYHHFHVSRLRKFAVIIPAHNEELSIAKTIQSMNGIVYPRDLFDTIVIADNCTDQTSVIARAHDARVMERTNQDERGKGYALEWAIAALLQSNRGYEGYVVIDADSIVSVNFLEVMNAYLDRGLHSIQSADLVSPHPGAWSSEVSRISLTLYNYARPLGRKVIGCSAGLRGNGMCFSRHALTTVPWSAHSITEDTEYGMTLLINGIPTMFAPEAKVEATMPVRSKNAESQRTRWESGRISIIKEYAGTLIRAFIQKPSFLLIDSFIELLTPAFVNMVAVVILMILFNYGVSFITGQNLSLLIGIWWGLLFVAAAYVIIGLYASGADSSLFKAMFYFPLYVLWKLMLYAKLVVHGISKEWVRTTREKTGNIIG